MAIISFYCQSLLELLISVRQSSLSIYNFIDRKSFFGLIMMGNGNMNHYFGFALFEGSLEMFIIAIIEFHVISLIFLIIQPLKFSKFSIKFI